MVAKNKKWYHSKVLWVNAIALVASIAQLKWGLIMDPATQGIILTLVNLILRGITKEEIVWSKKDEEDDLDSQCGE